MDYHVFKKPRTIKNKVVHRWYYYFVDPFTGKEIQKACRGCKTQAEAYAYVSSLPPLFIERKTTIRDITKYMFVPGGDHVIRLQNLGKQLDMKTITGKRFLLNLFVEQFGDLELRELTVPMVVNWLISVDRSGSWKNNMLTVIANVYDEAPFHDVIIQKPAFPKFARKTKKADIFTTDELNKLFDRDVWARVEQKMFANQAIKPDEDCTAIYLMFLCSASCGLRLGEAIGLRAGQFLFSEGMLVVDGFIKDFERIRTSYNKKGSEDDTKLRVVPIPDVLCTLMQEYIREKGLSDTDIIFSRYGIPIRKGLARKWFLRAVEEAGIVKGTRKLTPHSLRFTYVTRMRRNESGEIVQKIAGHSSIEMTDYYTRVSIPEMCKSLQPARAAANKLFD